MYTEQEISEFQKIAYNKLKNSNYDVEKIITELPAGKIDFDFGIALTTAVMYVMYANRVQGFQLIQSPHYEWI